MIVLHKNTEAGDCSDGGGAFLITVIMTEEWGGKGGAYRAWHWEKKSLFIFRSNEEADSEMKVVTNFEIMHTLLFFSQIKSEGILYFEREKKVTNERWRLWK